MGTLTGAPVKDRYQKLAWYNTSDNKLYKTTEDGTDVDSELTTIGNALTFSGDATFTSSTKFKNMPVLFYESSDSDTSSFSISRNADDIKLTTADNRNLVLNSGDGQYIEFWYDGVLRERIQGSSYSHQFHCGSNDFFAIEVHTDGQTDLRSQETGVGQNAHLNIVADGNMSLDAGAGLLEFKLRGLTVGNYINPIVASMIFGR